MQNLKDAYFTIPIAKQHRKCLDVRQEENLFEFIFLFFALGPASLPFTKLIKVSDIIVTVNKETLINLNNMLIMTRSVQNLNFQQDTVIYLLQNLEFVLNLKKSFLESTQNM